MTQSELFDVPGNLRAMRIFKVCGEAGKGRQARQTYIFVQASTELIATRIGRRWLRDVSNSRLTFVLALSWQEYGAILNRSGFTVT